jgi:MFS family permease
MQKDPVRRNFAALAGDFVLFSIGFAFYDPFVVVPAFVKEFTGSDLMVGVLSALRVLMITLPQMWAASVLVARPRKRPLLIWSSVGGRLPILLLVLATLSWTADAPWLVVGVLSLSVALFYISEGLNGISWPALVGKVIPDSMRGRFLGFGQLFSSLGALGAGYAVRLILSNGGSSVPARWAALFGCAFVGMMLSVCSMLFVREEAEAPATMRVAVGRSIRAMFGYLRTDSWLRLVVAAQLVLGTAGAVFPFFVVRARGVVPGSEQMIGLFLIMQHLGGVAAALICGQLIDRVGSWASIRLVTAVQVAALLAVSLASLGIPQVLYLAAFFLLGFARGSSWWSFSAYLLDMATDEQRPIYLAASGILTSPTFFGSIVVGGLLEVISFETVFVGALVLSGVGLVLAWAIPRPSASVGKGEAATAAAP